MSDILTSLHAAAVDWVAVATARGWLPAEAARTLDDAVLATPGALFGDGERPLVAALFGGTGVGKSTLMNRLARESVARASAERPTSREVIVYVHRAVSVEALAETLPMERVRTTLHAADAWRDVLWLDMPDIDSVETSNRELVTQWLPHVDALLYIVSPERYRDDEGWRLLLRHGANHAWLFVVNHWDRGDERQVEDFRALLVAAGLENPLIFRTDSSARRSADGVRTDSSARRSADGVRTDSSARRSADGVRTDSSARRSADGVRTDNDPDGAPDDFAELEATLAALADRRLIERLEARGVLQRVAALRARGAALHARLGDGAALAALPAAWEEAWARESTTLEEALGWRVGPFAAALAARGEPGRGGGLLGRFGVGLGTARERGDHAAIAAADPSPTVGAALSSATTPPRAATGATDGAATVVPALLDEDALGRMDGALERFVQQAADAGTLPLAVARRAVAPAREALCERLPRLVDDALRRSLAEPGSRWQRVAHRGFGALAGLLPLAAMAWIGWRVLDAFRAGATNPAAYLGSDFAVNAALLLALAWLLPLFLQRKLRPSRERAAARGARAGIARAVEEVRVVVGEALTTLVAERRALDESYAALWAATSDATDDALPERVRRMLFEGAPRDAQRDAGVRASTHSSTEAAPVS